MIRRYKAVLASQFRRQLHSRLTLRQAQQIKGAELVRKYRRRADRESPATEAEEVGVEHLLRDIKDASQGQLSKLVIDKINGLKALAGKLREMKGYLDGVISGKYRYDQAIVQNF